MEKRKTIPIGGPPERIGDVDIRALEEDLSLLRQSDADRNKAYERASTRDAKARRIAIFDDEQSFLDICVAVANNIDEEGNRLKLFTCRPASADEVALRIYELHRKNLTPDVLVIDYEFTNSGKVFDATDVLHALDAYDPSEKDGGASITKDADPLINRLKPRFLPRVVVTHLTYAFSITESLVRAGADLVYFGKGQGKIGGDGTDSGVIGAKHLFERLLSDKESDDLQLRAAQRAWRDVLLELETRIASEGSSPAGNPAVARDRIGALVSWIRGRLLEAGVAEHVHCRLAERGADGVLKLRNCGNWRIDTPEVVDWDEVPLLKKLAEKNLGGDDLARLCTRKIRESDLLHKKLKWLTEGFGFHAMGTPLCCRYGFFGTLTMARKRSTQWPPTLDPKKDRDQDKDPRLFTQVDSQNLIRVARRLSLHYSQMLDESLLRRRQQGLLQLAGDLSQQHGETEIIHTAVEFLHRELHLERELAYKREEYATDLARFGRVTCRLLEPGSGLLYRLDGWSLGYETDASCQELLSLGDVDSSMYAKCIAKGVVCYRHDKNDPQPYRKSTTEAMNTAMVVPMAINGIVIGAIHVEHRESGFYGGRPESPDEALTGNDNLDILKAVASVVGQALHNLRRFRFERELIRLAQTAESNVDKVMDQVAVTLYEFVGPGVLMWSEPQEEGKTVIVKRGWQGHSPVEAMQAIQQRRPLLVPLASEDLAKWNNVGSEGFFMDASLGRFRIDGRERVDYSEDLIAIRAEQDREVRHFPTTAQANLVVAEVGANAGLARNDALGVLALLFRRKPALSEEEKTLLTEFGSFLGAYLASVDRDIKYFSIEEQVQRTDYQLGIAHQSQHALKSRLSEIGDGLDSVELELKRRNVVSKRLSHLNERVRVMRAELTTRKYLPIDTTVRNSDTIDTCWRRACESLRDKIVAVNAIITSSLGELRCERGAEMLQEVFHILIDNSLDAFRDGGPTSQGGERCISAEGRATAGGIEVLVQDNGPGIPKEVRTRWARGEANVTTKASTGSGIDWCRRMLRQVAGQLEVLPETPGVPGAKILIVLKSDNDGK